MKVLTKNSPKSYLPVLKACRASPGASQHHFWRILEMQNFSPKFFFGYDIASECLCIAFWRSKRTEMFLKRASPIPQTIWRVELSFRLHQNIIYKVFGKFGDPLLGFETRLDQSCGHNSDSKATGKHQKQGKCCFGVAEKF